MADTEARRDPASAAAWRPMQAPRLTGALLLAGLLAVAGLGVLGLLASGTGELAMLGLLSLLAVAGVFFIFGMLSGYLRLSERVVEAEMVKAVADGLDGGLEIVDHRGLVVYRNRALQRLAGRRMGRYATLEEFFADEPDSAQAFFRLNRAAERADARDEEFFVGSRHGAGVAGRWLRVGVRPFLAPPRSGVEAQRLTLWQVTDVTRERTREIEAVSGLEATLAFYDSLPQGLFAVGPDGRIAHVNATLSHWLRLRPESGRTLTLLDIVSADTAALIRAAARTAEHRTTRLEVDLLREDGRAFPAQLVCRGHGSTGSISVLVLDRTEEPARAEAQAHPGTHLTRVFQAAPFGIATADAAGSIVTANAAFMRMFAVEGRGVPASVADLVAGGEEEAGRELSKVLERAVAGRTIASPVEISFGRQRELARRIYVGALDSGSRRGGAVLYAIDATEQKALELKFAQSHKMEAVGKLAGGVAHDFNNVLTAIIGFSDLLLQTHRQTDPAYRDIMNIKSSANRAASLVRQLLAFSRRQTLQPEVLELGEILTDLAPLLNRTLSEKIELKIQPGRDLWHVKADRSQFDNVIVNLAVNARDAMPNGGSLTIRTRNLSERESLKLADQGMAAGEYVLVEVEDTGVGIEPDIIGKIFEPFFTTKDVGKGTGLGLSTVYGIVKQTGGYVFAASQVGRGTTFRVCLPRHIVEREDEVVAQPREKVKETPRDLTGSGRVLLVEDEDIVRSFAARALARQGYEVLEAGTGLEALEVMEREGDRVDIVVSDVIMPEMDGPTLLKELRKSKPELKFIFISGHTDDAFKRTLDENEAYAFLPKPFTLPQLAAKVKEQLGR